MKAHELFPMLAAYNAWANERVYAAASKLDEVDYRGDYGLIAFQRQTVAGLA